MHKFKGGESEAALPPQICGPSLHRKIRVARGAAQVNVNYLRVGVEGCCPAHYIIHRTYLLHLLVGNGEGLVLRQGVGSRIGA